MCGGQRTAEGSQLSSTMWVLVSNYGFIRSGGTLSFTEPSHKILKRYLLVLF